MPLSSLFKGYAGKIVRRRSTNNKPCRCCYSSSSSTKLFSRFVVRQFHSSHALGFAELSDVWQGRNDKFVVESTISEHRRSLREKLKRSDGGVSKQILDSIARKNIDEWKHKLTMLLSNKDEQELVSRDAKDQRDFRLLSSLATKMGLYCHRYAKVVVFSKAPLPNYRPDLDDTRPQRELV